MKHCFHNFAYCKRSAIISAVTDTERLDSESVYLIIALRRSNAF